MRPSVHRLILAWLCALAGTVVFSGAAQAAYEVVPGSFEVVPSTLQAGGHPDLRTGFAINQITGSTPGEDGKPTGLLRDAEVVLPLGFAGYPAVMPTCDPVQLQLSSCPVDSQVGTLELAFRASVFDGPTAEGYFVNLEPLFNMKPSANQTAVYGWDFQTGAASGEIVISVGPDYRVRARSENIQNPGIARQAVTVWGVPADPSHDAQRGSTFDCEQQFDPSEFFTPGQEGCKHGGHGAGENPVPYLVNPSQCTGLPLIAEARHVTSWEGEEAPRQTVAVGPLTGCESLPFGPTLEVAPEESQATSPSGYEVKLNVPQGEGAEGLATADLKGARIEMPPGVVLSPSAANGLESCSEGLVGLGSEEPVKCPNASKLGTVSLVTPALTKELKGGLYLGGPGAGGSVTKPPFTVYLTFEGNGVLVKIKGTATPNPVTGQVTTVFDENPELPFSELKVHLNGGSRATLANPSTCGSFAAESDFTPWSTPFIADVTGASAPFTITGCGAPRFAPAFEAGTTSNQAGGYSPLSVTFSREDTDQDLGGLTVTTPPGLTGNLAKVQLCGEPQAGEGTCPQSSQIGEVTAGAGPGPEPYFIKGGRVYLTGPYNGAPFGLSIDVSEKAGPFDLGSGACDCEVVRASVSVDPHTAALTVIDSTLPTGKYGIPFQVKKVNVLINRPEFVFNPTNCDPMSVNGTIASTQGTNAQESSHFQVTNCGALGFNPVFKASTSGKTSKASGASLHVSLSYPTNSIGQQANIKEVEVQLPKALPSRLTTLQKACLKRVFEANPASCPPESLIGSAKATVPNIPVPLAGPVYFVSNGGEAFPNLIMVLQGYGVTIELVGDTFISKAGITSSTFKTVPDNPVTAFEITLPKGPYSALDFNQNLCAPTKTVTVKKKVRLRVHGHPTTRLKNIKQQVTTPLQIPTRLVAQNGAVIYQTTPLTVTNCPKTKTKPKGRK